MVPIDAHHNGVRWAGEFSIDAVGPAQWTVQAWVDVFAGWRDEIARKLEAGQIDMSGETSEGIVILEEAAQQGPGDTRSEASFRLGQLLAATGEHEQAVDLFMSAAYGTGEPSPWSRPARLAAGHSLAALHRTEAAMAWRKCRGKKPRK